MTNYTVEVYEQLRGNGSKQYKVCAVVKKSALWGLISYEDRFWLKDHRGYGLTEEEAYSSFFDDQGHAVILLVEQIDKRAQEKKNNEIIHYKRILP